MNMEITLLRGEIRDAIAGFNKIVSGKQTIPVLGCVRVDVDETGAKARVCRQKLRCDIAGQNGRGASSPV